jgi:uncharacterized YccA/Bax inhibitor family protein
MESSNPVLRNKVFENARVGLGQHSMTVQGTVNKTLILFGVLLLTAGWSWSMAGNPSVKPALTFIFMGSMFAGLIAAVATSFKPNWAPVSAPIYAACQGVFLGIASLMFETRYPGIVINAVGLTFGVMLAMLMGYKAGFLQATPALRKGLTIAIIGLMVFYGIVWIASMFGVTPPGFINGGGPLGIAFSLFVVGLAAMSLVLDFDFIESAAREGLSKKMEWYGAFGLMVTLIWLYIEILRLLSKTRD